MGNQCCNEQTENSNLSTSFKLHQHSKKEVRGNSTYSTNTPSSNQNSNEHGPDVSIATLVSKPFEKSEIVLKALSKLSIDIQDFQSNIILIKLKIRSKK